MSVQQSFYFTFVSIYRSVALFGGYKLDLDPKANCIVSEHFSLTASIDSASFRKHSFLREQYFKNLERVK